MFFDYLVLDMLVVFAVKIVLGCLLLWRTERITGHDISWTINGHHFKEHTLKPNYPRLYIAHCVNAHLETICLMAILLSSIAFVAFGI